MIKKIISALLTAIMVMLFLVVLFGFIIETSYTFILMNSYWFNTHPVTIIEILIILTLILSLIIFACIADKD